jgi:hypothetical protein
MCRRAKGLICRDMPGLDAANVRLIGACAVTVVSGNTAAFHPLSGSSIDL